MQMNGSSTFSLPIRLMPSAQRASMQAFYMLCRTLDDIADDTNLPAERKLAMLDEWQTKIDALCAGTPSDALTLTLLPAAMRGEIVADALFMIIEGMRMDARGQMFMPSLSALDDYCFCVAGCVGVITIRLMGDSSDEARRYALHLGQAMQRTNILRDILEDAAMGRIYLPRELMQAHHLDGLKCNDVAQHLHDLRPIIAHVAAQADEHYEQATAIAAEHIMPTTARMMADSYTRLHEQMRADGWQHHGRYRLGLKDKLWLAGRVLNYQAA